MSTHRVKNLWGQDFRVVNEGLAESDVEAFVETLMAQHHACQERLSHIAALYKLAEKTVQEAERLATRIKREAQEKSESNSARIITEARHRAQEIDKKVERAARTRAEAIGRVIIEAAEKESSASEAEPHKKVRERIAKIDSALHALKEAASEELSMWLDHSF